MKLVKVFNNAWLHNNAAWVQLLGLCPLLAVSNSLVNALGLSLATALVIVGSNTSVSLLARMIPDHVRLPCFVLIIATFTTTAMLLLQAYAFDLYLGIALFVQIIVTNCMILSRAEAFASRQPPLPALVDALGTACGFTLALLTLGITRELLGSGTLFAGMEQLFGPNAADWRLEVLPANTTLTLLKLPPGAFLGAGLLLALANSLRRTAPSTPFDSPQSDSTTDQ